MAKKRRFNIINPQDIDPWLDGFIGHDHGYYTAVRDLLHLASKRHILADARIVVPLDAPPENAPAWLLNKWDTCGPFHRFDPALADGLRHDIMHIRDWLLSAKQTNAPFLSDCIEGKPKTLLHIRSVSHAVALADAYFSDLNKRLSAHQDTEDVDIKTVMTFDDGYRFVQLLTPNALKNEGPRMGHCIGSGAYDGKLSTGAKYYSLRDAQNNPHVTIEVINNYMSGQINQCRGKENKQPADKYIPYVQKFVRQKKLSATYALRTGDYTGLLENDGMPLLDLLNPPDIVTRAFLEIEIENFIAGAKLPRTLRSPRGVRDTKFIFNMSDCLVNKEGHHLLPQRPFVLPEKISCKGTVEIKDCKSVGGYPMVLPQELTANTLVLKNVFAMKEFPSSYRVKKVIIEGHADIAASIPSHVAVEIHVTAETSVIPAGRVYDLIKMVDAGKSGLITKDVRAREIDLGYLSTSSTITPPPAGTGRKISFSVSNLFDDDDRKKTMTTGKARAFFDIFNKHAATIEKQQKKDLFFKTAKSSAVREVSKALETLSAPRKRKT